MCLKKRLVQAVLILSMVTGLSFSSAHANPLEHVFGAGTGLPYGGDLGFNYELSINDYLAPTIGIGWLPDNFGWNLGVRGYYPGRESRLRGRATLLYGTTSVHKRINAAGTDYKTDNGFSLGLGVEWRFAEKWGVCGDLFFAQTDTPAGFEEKDDDLFLALGVSYHW